MRSNFYRLKPSFLNLTENSSIVEPLHQPNYNILILEGNFSLIWKLVDWLIFWVVRLSYLYSWFSESNSRSKFFSHEDIRIVSPSKTSLELVELRWRESSPMSLLLYSLAVSRLTVIFQIRWIKARLLMLCWGLLSINTDSLGIILE